MALQDSSRCLVHGESPENVAENKHTDIDEPLGVKLRKCFVELGYLGVNLDKQYHRAYRSEEPSLVNGNWYSVFVDIPESNQKLSMSNSCDKSSR